MISRGNAYFAPRDLAAVHERVHRITLVEIHKYLNTINTFTSGDLSESYTTRAQRSANPMRTRLIMYRLIPQSVTTKTNNSLWVTWNQI